MLLGERKVDMSTGRRQRVIDRIELTYVRTPNFRGQATVCAEGLQ